MTEESDAGIDHQEEVEVTEDLPRFAATREFVLRYGDDWAAWAFPVTGIATLTALELAFADAAAAPVDVVLPSIVSFGVCGFIGGMFAGVLWASLRQDAKERQELKA